MGENLQTAPQSNYLKLTPVSLLNESIVNLAKPEVLEKSCEERKKILEKSLIEGVNIKNEKEFNSWFKLLKNNGIIENIPTIDFSIPAFENGIGIKRLNFLDENITVFRLNKPFGLITTPYFPKEGYINKNGEYKQERESSSIDKKYYPSKGNNTIPQNLGECKAEENSVIALEKPTETHTSYTIQKGDSLWKIVCEKYGLENKEENYRDIANIIEKLKKDHKKNKGVIKDETGKIFVGDTLYLPKTVKFKYKGGEDKEFKLK